MNNLFLFLFSFLAQKSKGKWKTFEQTMKTEDTRFSSEKIRISTLGFFVPEQF